MLTMDYNFVIIGTNYDFDYLTYRDVLNISNVQYIKELLPKNRILRFLKRLHYSKRVNRYFEVPFKSIWNNLYYVPNFGNNKTIVFIYFFNHLKEVDNGLLFYFKRKYINSKHVLWFVDLISTLPNADIKKRKQQFDLIISYDPLEAKKYDLLYHPTVYNELPNVRANNINTGVFFIGQLKNRHELIYSSYLYLKSHGIVCNFVIIDINYTTPSYFYNEDGINVVHHFVPYEESLKMMNSYSCILEIIQEGSSGYTYRTWEAVMYNKILISNNHNLKNAPFYSTDKIIIINTPNDIKIDTILNKRCEYDEIFKEQMSSRHFINFIEENLKKKK